jgi:hypothetical protein
LDLGRLASCLDDAEGREQLRKKRKFSGYDQREPNRPHSSKESK